MCLSCGNWGPGRCRSLPKSWEFAKLQWRFQSRQCYCCHSETTLQKPLHSLLHAPPCPGIVPGRYHFEKTQCHLEVLCGRCLFCPLAERWVFLFLTPASFQGICKCTEFCKEEREREREKKKADPFLHLKNQRTHHCTLYKIPTEKILED